MTLRCALATIAFVLCAASCGDTQTPPEATSVADRSVVASEAGAQLFDLNCSGCHALGGSGSPPGPNLAASRPSEDEIVGMVANGGVGMPSYRDKLTNAQIAAIAKYVERTLGP